MADATVRDVITWKPYAVLGEANWPHAWLGSSFWHRRHFDVDNIIGPYDHYIAAVPTPDEINAGFGLNQIIAAILMVSSMHPFGGTVAPPAFVVLPDLRNVSRFPLEWEVIKFYINSVRYKVGLSDYTWTLPFDDLEPQTQLYGKNKISFIDLAEFRDALNDVTLVLDPKVVSVYGTSASFKSVEMHADMNELAGAGIIGPSTRNKYQWSFLRSSGLMGLLVGDTKRRSIPAKGLNDQVYGGTRFIFQFQPNKCMPSMITGLKLKGRMKKNNTDSHYKDTIVRVFAPTSDPSLIGLSDPGAFGSPLTNSESMPYSADYYPTKLTHRPYIEPWGLWGELPGQASQIAPTHRRASRPATPMTVNGSYWPDFIAGHYGNELYNSWYSSSLLSAVSHTNENLEAWRARTEPNFDLTINGTLVIKWDGATPNSSSRYAAFVLLLGQTNPNENGLWVFYTVGDPSGGSRRAYVERGGWYRIYSARMATTGNITTLSGLKTIDGIAGVEMDTVLVKNQTSARFNGLYYMRSTAWTLAWGTGNAFHYKERVVVNEGLVNGKTTWVCNTSDYISWPVTPVTFVLFNWLEFCKLSQWLFGWPGTVDGSLWQLRDDPGGGYSFQELTAEEMRFLDIYDVPLLGTELGSIDTTSIPNDNAFHDVEIDLTGLPAWLYSSENAYFVLAVDGDLTRPSISLLESYRYERVTFEIESIIPQV